MFRALVMIASLSRRLIRSIVDASSGCGRHVVTVAVRSWEGWSSSPTKERPVQVLSRGEMSKKSTTRRGSRVPSETHALRPGPNWPLLALSSVGMLLTGYLAWTAFSGGAVQGCSAGVGCDIVLTSRWATLFGLPTSLWGLLAYTA